MFKWYGFVGIFLVLFSQAILILGIPMPFTTFLVWLGYILVVDCFNFMIKKNSYLMDRRLKLFLMFLLSAIVWFIFELFNSLSKFPAWYYVNLPTYNPLTFIRVTLAFSTIIPAILETSELIGALHSFRKLEPKIKLPINNFIVYIVFASGATFMLIPFVISTPWIWVFIWTGFILLVDPILYIFHDEKSILFQIKKRKFHIIVSLIIAGYICGFLWEFWNYWAHTKWYYSIPVLENIKIFEIPVIGFLAYGPFALELYVMYRFMKLLFSKKILGRII